MRGAMIDMVYGTLRRYGRGDAILARLAQRGIADTGIRALLLCALHAIESARYAEHVAVDQAVREAGPVTVASGAVSSGLALPTISTNQAIR